MIFISKAEHLPSFRNRGAGELGNGLFVEDRAILMVITIYPKLLQRRNAITII